MRPIATDDLSDPENWTGGFYELLLVLGATDDARFDRAVRSLWRAADVRECRVGPGLVETAPGADAFTVDGHLRGTLTLPSGDRVVCGSYAYRYEGVDSLELHLPLGVLERTDDRIGGYPFDHRSGVESLAWRAPLDRWLADIAVRVYDDVPFERALIGFEIDEDADTTVDRRYAAQLSPGVNGMDYRPATT
ncbi:hypothetical protein [Micromonospora tarensis]|uniref:Uncharacterized protein n=1 Tax=Micromonospora tarensis TaxID=2806100 RepID=A0ABS1YCS5_9ACTN|nr:hypothetical protein [Micromonospora tarensis]MBM0275216.1 hypothetical protein [Micromonospora tarensis]